MFVPKPIRKGQNDHSAAGDGVGTTFRAPGAGKKLFSLGIKSVCWGGVVQSKPEGVLKLF